MNWEEGQKVECAGLDWGACYVTMSNPHMVVIYCPRYEMVTTASPAKLEQAGWKVVSPSSSSHLMSGHSAPNHNVVWLENWKKPDRQNCNPMTRV